MDINKNFNDGLLAGYQIAESKIDMVKMILDQNEDFTSPFLNGVKEGYLVHEHELSLSEELRAEVFQNQQLEEDNDLEERKDKGLRM